MSIAHAAGLPDDFQRILVIRRDNIGDLLCTTPLLAALRRRYPRAHIAVLANSYNAPVLDSNPDIDRVYAYTKAKHAGGARLMSWWREWALYRSLRRARFELIIHANPTVHPRTGRLARYLGAPYRLGVDDGRNSYNIALDPAAVPRGHHVEQVFSLLAPLGITDAPGPLTLVPPSVQKSGADQPVVGVHLSSRKPCNRWPLSSYRELITRLAAESVRIKLFWAPGSNDDPLHPGDDDLADLLCRDCDTVEPVPTQTLAELIRGLTATDLVVCPDGGALHMAAALDRPVVALFGCTDPSVWRPWGVDHVVLEGHGRAECIDAAEAATAALTMLQRRAI